MLQMATALQTTPLVHPRVQSLTRTHMKTINPTEELAIATILLIGEAIGVITTHLLVPGASVILAGLGWRPPTRLEVEPPFTTPEELQLLKAFPLYALTDPTMGVPWEDAIPATAPVSAPLPGREWSRAILQPASLRELRGTAERRKLDHSGLAKPELIEAILDDIDDEASNANTEVPTAEERSPSLRRRGKR